MKKILIISSIILGLVMFSQVADAHMGEAGNMMYSTSGNISPEEFEEMQDVMIKMMGGEELTESESKEMIDFMQEHHGGYFPMMRGYGMSGQAGMMWGTAGSFITWILALTTVVWLLVGILLSIFLVKKISSK